MPDERTKFETGCRLEPGHSGTPNIKSLIGAQTLPKAYAVPAFRKAITFDESGELTINPGVVTVRNQHGRPSCVGQATAVQKSSQEGVMMSARDIYRIAKRLDGTNDPVSWGTSLWAGQQALVRGTAEEELVPELPADKGTAAYVDLSDVTPEVEANRDAHRAAPRPYNVSRDAIRSTLFSTGNPVVTSCAWYDADNDIGHNGRAVMGMPSGAYRGGHAFPIVAFGLRNGRPVLVALQSWGEDWGVRGFFFIPLADAFFRLGNGYVSVDIEEDLAELLARYDGKNVALIGTPDLYRCEGGKLRKWPNEKVWWAHGNLFGFDVVDITPNAFKTIPKGSDMSIDDAPFETRELVRQIAQHYGR